MNTSIIGFDPMKFQKDVLNNQPSDLLIKNVLQIVKDNFPGTTHIAISVPMNTNAEMVSNGTVPGPRSIEVFTETWIDAIHAAGYNVVLRGTPCEVEKIWNFPLHVDTHMYWVTKGIDYLNRIKAHLKNGDIAGMYPELEGHIWDGTGACIDDQTGNQNADYNNFYNAMAQAVIDWAAQNGVQVKPYITINRSEAINGWIGGSFYQKMGAVVIDYYGEAQTLAEMPGKITELHTKWNLPVYQQEWGDTRPPATVAADPAFTAEMADTVFFPALKSGELLGIDFWNLFDTPQEGILSVSGESVALNGKGQALAKVFQKWFGATQPASTTSSATTVPVTTAGAVTKLGGLNLDTYCTLSNDGTAKLQNQTWECSGNSKQIDLTAVCKLQYKNPDAYAKQDTASNPYSWTCYVGTTSTTPTTVPTTSAPVTSPVVLPAGTFTFTSGTVTSDGKGNMTLTLKK